MAAGRYLKPIKSKSVVQQVIERLTDAIVDGRIKPGDRIPTEQELADSFGVSRNSVREAIKILVSYGVLEIRRPEGTFVANGFTEPMINPLMYGILLQDEESMESLKELREWIDVGIIYQAIKKANGEDIKQLKKALDVFQHASDMNNVDDLFKADDDFHACLADMTHNVLYAKIAHVTRLLTKSIRYQTIKNMVKMGKSEVLYKVHEDMYFTITSRNMEGTGSIVHRSYFYEDGVLDDK